MIPVRIPLLLLGTAALVMHFAAGANTPDNPYRAIVERNIFGLKDPPPPAPPEATKPPPSKLTLTGITTILGKKQVLLKTAAAPAKPGEQPKGEQSYIITEGVREGDIEVLEINEVAGSVKLIYAGVPTTLDFEKDGPKLPSTPAPGAPRPPGTPGAVAGIPIPSVIRPGGASPMTPNTLPGMRTIPTRNLRVPGSSSGSTSPAYDAAPAYGTPGAGAADASGTLSTASLLSPASSGGVRQNWPPERQLTREEQAAMIEVERARLQAEGNPAANLLPSTGFNPTGGQNTGTSAPQAPVIQTPPLPPGGPQPF